MDARERLLHAALAALAAMRAIAAGVLLRFGRLARSMRPQSAYSTGR